LPINIGRCHANNETCNRENSVVRTEDRRPQPGDAARTVPLLEDVFGFFCQVAAFARVIEITRVIEILSMPAGVDYNQPREFIPTLHREEKKP
jgi:hypothetical protein